MKVNGKDVLETYGLKQWNVEMAYGEIGNESSWEDGCPVPVLLESNFGLKKIKVSVLAKGENRDEIWGKTGKLLAEMAKPAVLELDGFSHHFKTVLTNAQQVENSMNRFHKATLELVGYEYGEHKVATMRLGEKVKLENKGTLYSPVSIAVQQQRQYEPENTVYVSYEDTGITGTSPTVIIGKFKFEGTTELLSFDAATGKVEQKLTTDEEAHAGGLDKMELLSIPRVPPGGMEVSSWQVGGSAATTITMEYDEMYI